MRLYDDPCSGNGYKVRLILALLGRAYDYVPLDIDKAETRTPEFLAKNPNGRYPCWNWTTAACCPNPTRSCTILPTARRSCPPTPSPTRRYCNGCSSSSTATSPTSRPSASG